MFPDDKKYYTRAKVVIIALASATGEKKKKKKKKKKAWAKEGPKAPTQARSTEEEAEGLRRLGLTCRRPRKKSFQRKLKNLPALYIHDYVKLKTRLSRKRPS